MDCVTVPTIMRTYPCLCDVPAVWTYEATDPLAVSLLFMDDADHPARWEFSRQLLIDALDRSSRTLRQGEGDVTIIVMEDLFVLGLENEHGQTEFYCDIRTARAFLTSTMLMCPPCIGIDSVDHDFCLECSLVNSSIEELL